MKQEKGRAAEWPWAQNGNIEHNYTVVGFVLGYVIISSRQLNTYSKISIFIIFILNNLFDINDIVNRIEIMSTDSRHDPADLDDFTQIAYCQDIVCVVHTHTHILQSNKRASFFGSFFLLFFIIIIYIRLLTTLVISHSSYKLNSVTTVRSRSQ